MSGRTVERTGRRFGSVVDIRHEIFRIYHAVKLGRMDDLVGYRRARILDIGARLMTETEPEIELRKMREKNEELETRAAQLEARVEMMREAETVPWSTTKLIGVDKPN